MVNLFRKALIAGGLVGLLGCGDDSNNCEVRESEGCEDFTGLYGINNYEEFLQCNTILDEWGEGDTWLWGSYISIRSSGDCHLDVYNHSGDWNRGGMPGPHCNARKIFRQSDDATISGNHVSRTSEGQDYFNLVKCDDISMLFETTNVWEDSGKMTQCSTYLSKVPGEIYDPDFPACNP